MSKIYFNTKVYIFTIMICLLSGCGITHQYKVPKINDLSDLAQKSNDKFIVYLDFRSYTGAPDGDYVVDAIAGQEEEESIYNTLKESNLFSEVIYDDDEIERADYTIEISTYKWQEGVGGAIITGLTLGIIPMPGELIYFTKVKYIDRQGKIIHEYKNKDVATIWVGWLAPLIAEHGGTDRPQYDMTANNIKDALKHMYDSGVLNKHKLINL